MAAHHLAQGLASLGRNGDTMLMHVTPNEVAGLKNLAKSMGGEVTTNPHTGLPEASFFDFIGNMAPMFMGMLLGPEVLGASMLGEGGLGLTGTALKAAETALPIVGGAGTAAALGGDPLMGALGGYGGAGVGGSFAKMGTPGGWAGQAIPAAESINGGLQAGGYGQGMATTLAKAAPAATTAAQGFGNLTSGIGKLASDPTGNWQAFKDAGGSGMKLGLPIGMAALNAMQPEPLDMSAEEAKRKAEEDKYRDKLTGGLNLSASSGLTLAAHGGLIQRYATGGTTNINQSTVSSGGLQDLYGANDNATGNTQLSQDGYGIGRLDRLASAGSNAKAADEFYAAGGPVAFADGGDTETHMNLNDLGSLNVNTGRQGGSGGGGLADILYSINDKAAMSPILKMLFEKMSPSTRGDFISSGMGSFMGLQERPKQEYYTSNGDLTSSYAHGGYLDGQGDGMSDSIPATIEGQQQARLADGEFVVPADVVSHLGNGSSKAGSKRLYTMLDKVRQARTGHTKQGKQINPNKYMPA